MQIFHYIDSHNRDRYQDWIDELKDINARVAIQRRIDRIASTGNLGTRRFCKNGVWELKINVGPGYRVYYTEARETMVLLLSGGSKKTQKRDIELAVEYRQDYLKRL